MWINNKIGRIGEGIACACLVKKGWRIVARNYRRKSDEIDIIAVASDKTLVFCEVKALLVSDAVGASGLAPEDNLTDAKLRKISRTCEFFARQNPHLINEERGWRIDLLAIDIGLNGTASGIRHYENI
jgi:putative endonuclease